jgi:hypothetical protein
MNVIARTEVAGSPSWPPTSPSSATSLTAKRQLSAFSWWFTASVLTQQSPTEPDQRVPQNAENGRPAIPPAPVTSQIVN